MRQINSRIKQIIMDFRLIQKKIYEIEQKDLTLIQFIKTN